MPGEEAHERSRQLDEPYGLRGWSPTRGTPEVFVDDWLEPPSELHFKKSFLPWVGLTVSLGKGAAPKLTGIAEQDWRQQYLRESVKSVARQVGTFVLFFFGIWIVAGGGLLIYAALNNHGGRIAVVGGVLLIAVGAALVIAFGLVLGTSPGLRGWEDARQSDSRDAGQARGPSG